PFAANLPLTLSAGDGQKTVSARFRDAAGNESATVTALIELDTVGPGTIHPLALQRQPGATRLTNGSTFGAHAQLYEIGLTYVSGAIEQFSAANACFEVVL